jgi:hypothetical protein
MSAQARSLEKSPVSLSCLAGIVLAILSVCAVLVFFPTQFFSDSLCNAYTVEKAFYAPEMPVGMYFNPLGHPLQNSFYYMVAWILSFFGYHGRLLIPLQVTSMIFSILAVLAMYLVILRLSGDPVSAFLAGAIFGTGYSFWYWSGQVKSYPISTFFILLALLLFIRFPNGWGVVLSAAFSALAVGFFQGAVPVMGVMAVLVFFRFDRLKSRLLYAGAYILSAAVFAFLVYSASSALISGSITARTFRDVYEMFWDVFSKGAIPGGNSFFFAPEGSVFRDHFAVLMRSVVSESFAPGGKWMGWGFNTIPDFSEGMLRAGNFISMVVLAGFLVLLVIFVLRRRSGIERPGMVFAVLLVWTLLFSTAFFLVDPSHVYTYICSTGMIVFMGAAAGKSRTGKAVLAVLFLLLLQFNGSQMLAARFPDHGLEECRNLEGVVRRGDVFFSGYLKDSFFAPSWSLTYYFRISEVVLEGEESRDFVRGRVSPRIRKIIAGHWKAGRRVFINITKLLGCYSPGQKDAILKNLSARFTLRAAFKAHDTYMFPEHQLEVYYRILPPGAVKEGVFQPETFHARGCLTAEN